jgi:hypothetical protein
MNTTIRLAAFIAPAVLAALVVASVGAQNGNPVNKGSADPITLAVFGDWPYSQNLKDTAGLLINSINSDPKVKLVMHVGDIHSGSMPCTGAGLSPIPAGSVPSYNKDIFDLFNQFKDPLIYTPGDNEWTDCHKTGQLSSGAPLLELAAVRDLFFWNPGYSLGLRTKQVISQANVSDPFHPTDAKFVENVMWEESQTVFVTMNVPGSNNDHLKWTAPFTDEPARAQEALEREAANLRWLARAFALAEATGARAVVIGIQADMWDPAQAPPVLATNNLNGYDEFVQSLAALAVHFNKPVLLLNGDSHLYGSDQPLSAGYYGTGALHDIHHVGFPVPNLTRITVQGSTNVPHEWLRLTIDPRAASIFSWQNVIYCASDPCVY